MNCKSRYLISKAHANRKSFMEIPEQGGGSHGSGTKAHNAKKRSDKQ